MCERPNEISPTMNHLYFENLSSDLRALAAKIPLHWGAVQNNRFDDAINMFDIETYGELERALQHLPQDHANYLRRRWYLWKCSLCDEYLFYRNANVQRNPNHYDKSYDVRFNGNLDFDIKGTVIPREMRDNVEHIIQHPEDMVRFFYEKQSTGRRFDIQNRLYIVHHSCVDPQRELYLRCAWESKKNCYEQFANAADRISFVKYRNVISGVIFILERTHGTVTHIIHGLR